MQFEITKSVIPLTQKPIQGIESAIIKNSIRNKYLTDVDDLSNVVLTNAFNCSLSNGISTKDWISQQVFGLDFDGGFTYQDLVDRLQKYQLTANIIYATYSDSPLLRRFRVLFILDEPILIKPIAQYIQKGLLELFPEADKACVSLCHMYYPGKTLLGVTSELNERQWFESVCMSAVRSTNPRVDEKIDFNKIGVYYQQSYNIYIGLLEKYTKDQNTIHFDWKAACDKLKILDIFFNTNSRVSYHILFSLATNLQFINGGLLKMQAKMEEVNTNGGGNYIPEGSNRMDRYPNEYFVLIKGIRKWKYLPTQLENFSPYETDHEFHNIFDLEFKKGSIEILKEPELIELNDAENVLKDAFTKVLKSVPFTIQYNRSVSPIDVFGKTYSNIIPYAATSSIFDNNVVDDDDIYLFKLSTGIGKTRLLEGLSNYLLAFPTHDLKDEVSNRMMIDHYVTPRYATFSNQLINDKLRDYTDCDLFTPATNIIHSIADNNCIIDKNRIALIDDDILKAQIYIEQNTQCRNTRDTVLTTHTRALFDTSFKHKTIIFDEDPLSQLVSIRSCSLDFSCFDDCSQPIKDFINTIESYYRQALGTGYIENTKLFYKQPQGFEQLCATKKRGDIIQLLKSTYITKEAHDVTRVNYLVVKQIPTDKKLIIMSATLPIEIYKKLYGSRVKVVDISNIKHVGIVEQWTNRSFSTNGMRKYLPKVYDEIFNIISGEPVITHMSERQKFKKDNWSKYYFGNCSGGDDLKGQNISIVGTPNKPDYVYYFYAKLMGLDNATDFTLSDQLIEWNNFRFRFFTYNNEILRDIQLSLIESELLQACGRNRTLREYCMTKVFSTLPLKITKKFHYENLTKKK